MAPDLRLKRDLGVLGVGLGLRMRQSGLGEHQLAMRVVVEIYQIWPGENNRQSQGC